MSLRHLTVSALILAGSLAFTAETPGTGLATQGKPWTDTFAMTLKGKERTYVVYQGNSYLMGQPGDLIDPGFLDQKDVMFNAKLGRVEGTRVHFYNMPKVEASGPLELWRTRVDGDNLFVFGRIAINAGTTRFTIVGAENAPSDAQIIAAKLAGVPATDYAGRLAVAAWTKDMATQQGNREFWLVSADNIVSQVVDDAAAQAETDKDVALVLQAMGWCQDLLHDIPRAARVGSAAWIRTAGGTGAEEVAKHMRRWDLEFYAGQWRPRGEALAQEFQDRFSAIGWRDAEGYYKLGRWADANAEVLPRARELSYRCYQAGFRANPNHNGIRRELAMEPAQEGGSATTAQGDFKDNIAGVTILSPPGWSRTDPIEGDATWIDPSSDTAFITAKLLRNPEALVDFKALWSAQLASLQSKSGYTNISEEKLTFAEGEARHVRYSYREGRYLRMADMAIAQNPAGKAAVRLDASAAENEAEAVRKQFLVTFAHLTIPAASAVITTPPAAGGAATQPPGPAGQAPSKPNPQPSPGGASAKPVLPQRTNPPPAPGGASGQPAAPGGAHPKITD